MNFYVTGNDRCKSTLKQTTLCEMITMPGQPKCHVGCSHSRMLLSTQYFSQLADVYCVHSLSDVVSEYPDALSSPAPATMHRPRYVSSEIPLHTQTTVHTVTSRHYNWTANRRRQTSITNTRVSEWVSAQGLTSTWHITGHFRDESFQAIDRTGTDNQKENKTLHTLCSPKKRPPFYFSNNSLKN